MSLVDPGPRPASVSFAAAMMFLASLGYAVLLVIHVYLIFQPGEAQLFFSTTAPDFYWILMACLDAVLIFGFAWIGLLAMRGDPGAGMTINLLALINLVFSLFNILHGVGWATLLISVLVLIINNTASAKAWYRTGASLGE